MDSRAKIVFFGGSVFGLPALKSLLGATEVEVVLVVLAPRKDPVSEANFIKNLAFSNNIKLEEPSDLLDSKFIKILNRLKPDIGVVVDYGKIIPSQIIELHKKGILNIHPSLLPTYRGPNPIRTAILNGDNLTGVSIIKIDNLIDHGEILSQEEAKIEQDEGYSGLSKRLSEKSASLLIRSIRDYLEGKIVLKRQDDKKATYTKKVAQADAKIDFSDSLTTVINKIRAFDNNPIAHLFFYKDNKKIQLNIKKATLNKERYKDTPPGLYFSDKKLILAVSDGLIELEDIQPESKKALSGRDFINGYRRYLKEIKL